MPASRRHVGTLIPLFSDRRPCRVFAAPDAEEELGDQRSLDQSRIRTFGQLSACVCLRVSTGRQAASDLSIPDQRKSVQADCAARGWPVIAEHVEPGASALADNRPAFQAMIARAEDGDRPYDVIVVRSLSRFFRDALGMEMYVRRLARVGVRLVSRTEEHGDDPAAEVVRPMFAPFDESSSHENSRHVQRATNENPRHGFDNGSHLPLGCTLEGVERRGSRMKKRAIVDPVEAETVLLIVRLYRHGDGLLGLPGPVGHARHARHRSPRRRPAAARAAAVVDGRAAALRGELTAADEKLRRLYRLVEVGANVLRITGAKESLETAATGAGGTAVTSVRSSVRRMARPRGIEPRSDP